MSGKDVVKIIESELFIKDISSKRYHMLYNLSSPKIKKFMRTERISHEWQRVRIFR